MTFSQATAYLEQLKPAGMQMGLERMEHAAEVLGHPERAYPCVHIAGTNGKGSTARMIAAMLTANGYRTGLYTSPMVTDITDMILIDDNPIDKACFADCIETIANAVPSGLSEYECLTTAVFLAFQREKVDVAVIECCLGGETDATNILPAPLCAVFTPIAKDHTAILGNTIEDIARVKGGIIKPSCDVVCAPSMCPEALGEIFEKASLCGSSVHLPSAPTSVETGQHGTFFCFDDEPVTLSLIGKHQAENAVTALTVMNVLTKRGFRSEASQNLRALTHVTMPCRQEIISRTPLIMLDGAHNPHGIEALCRTLEKLDMRNATLIIGMLTDKEVKTCLEMMSPYFSRAICCTPPHTPRAMQASTLAELAADCFKQVDIEDDPIKAFQKAKNTDNPLVVGGSFYTSSVVRRELN